MAHIHIIVIRICLLLISTMSGTACVITKIENDIFHKKTWECTEIPLGPLGVETLTLSFDKENVATIVLIFANSARRKRGSINVDCSISW